MPSYYTLTNRRASSEFLISNSFECQTGMPSEWRCLASTVSPSSDWLKEAFSVTIWFEVVSSAAMNEHVQSASYNNGSCNVNVCPDDATLLHETRDSVSFEHCFMHNVSGVSNNVGLRVLGAHHQLLSRCRRGRVWEQCSTEQKPLSVAVVRQ